MPRSSRRRSICVASNCMPTRWPRASPIFTANWCPMAGRRRKSIDRRITVATPESLAIELLTNTIIFADAWGEAIQQFDPEQLPDLPADLRGLLAVAFREHGAGQSPATRRTTWGAIRRCARFVADAGLIKTAGDVDTTALGRYVPRLRV